MGKRTRSFRKSCFTNFNISNADSIQYCIIESSCHSSCDGEISITVYGNNQPYFFEWGSEGIITANDNFRDSLCAGNYSVTITDNNNNFVFDGNINFKMNAQRYHKGQNTSHP